MLVLMVFWMCSAATWCRACVDGLLDVFHSYMVSGLWSFGCVPQLHGVVRVLMVFWMCATATWCSACVDGLLDVCHSYMV